MKLMETILHNLFQLKIDTPKGNVKVSELSQQTKRNTESADRLTELMQDKRFARIIRLSNTLDHLTRRE